MSRTHDNISERFIRTCSDGKVAGLNPKVGAVFVSPSLPLLWCLVKHSLPNKYRN